MPVDEGENKQAGMRGNRSTGVLDSEIQYVDYARSLLGSCSLDAGSIPAASTILNGVNTVSFGSLTAPALQDYK